MGMLDKMKEAMAQAAENAANGNPYAGYDMSSLMSMLEEENKKIGPWKDKDRIAGLEKAIVIERERVANEKAQYSAAVEASGMDAEHTIGANLNLTDLSKLAFLNNTPHSFSDERVAEIAGKAPMLGKDKWRASIENALLAYLYVVEANSALLTPGKDQHGAVFVMAKDIAHLTDKEFLYRVGDKIAELRQTGDYSKNYKSFFKMLNNEQSHMWYDLDSEITGGPEATCFSDSMVDASKLPNGFLPTDRIVPVLVSEINTKPTYLLIPGEYYKA